MSTTIAFGPDELSSVVNVPATIVPLTQSIGSSIVSTVTDTEFTTTTPAPMNYPDLGENCSTVSGYSFVPGNPSQTGFSRMNSYPLSPRAFGRSIGELTVLSIADPCHPAIVLPERVKSLEPAWASCVSNGIGG